MDIKDQKDLAKLIALCRKTGIQSIRVDNVEFHLGPEPTKTRAKWQIPKTGITIPNSGITESTGPDVVENDEMSEEQLLMWSVTGSPDANAADNN